MAIEDALVLGRALEAYADVETALARYEVARRDRTRRVVLGSAENARRFHNPALADPVGKVTESWTRPNGMTIERVRVPLGVVGVIYESRPNVTADAGALTLKAGNAVILRGGSDSHRS